MRNAREVALHILMKIDEDNAFSNILLNSELNKEDLSENEKAFTTQLVYGVIANKICLDYIISKCSKVKLKKISTPILNILRSGIFQIYYLDKIPVSAVCNEAVKLAKKYGHISSANFVNAILRNVSRTEKESFFNELEDDEDKLSVFYSYPKWIVELFVNQYGIDSTKKLLYANTKVSYDPIRVNTLKTTREKIIERFNNSEEGKLKDIVYIYNTKEVLNSSEFKEGLVTFQDEAPALVAHLLEPKEQDKILDICAAPGGKTTHVAQLTNDKAKIIALDLYEGRCKLIEETQKRLGIKSITTRCVDATVFIPEFENYFDKIIADVPCSGLGVIRKKPDIKFNIEKEDIDKINDIQKKILVNASKYLKVGGTLVYSTCTNVFRENQETIKWFLENNSNFRVVTNENLIPESFKSGLEDGMLSLLPSIHGCDGFFICCIKRIK